jgi:hypothetical protein
MLRFRRDPLVSAREGCTSQLRIVLDGANSKEFSKQKAALLALSSLRENKCVSSLIYIMNDFSGSEDPFKLHLAEKAREYLKREHE